MATLAVSPPILYTQRSDIDHYLSAVGVQLRVDDDGDGLIDPATEQPAIDDAIAEASETCNYYLWDKYDPVYLGASYMVRRFAMVLAAYRLCSRRANPMPTIVEMDADKTEGRLEEIRRGTGKLPGVPLRRTLAPVMSLTRVIAWPYQFRCIRVERRNSSRWNQTALPQNIDIQESASPDPQN